MWTSNDSVWRDWNKLRAETIDTQHKDVDDTKSLQVADSYTKTVMEGDLFVIAYELHRIADYLQQLEKRH